MRLPGPASLLATTLLTTLACMAGDPTLSLPANTPAAARVESSTITPSPTQIQNRVDKTPTAKFIPFPAWVAEFADPILVSLDGRKPDFQDEFTQQLNRGWFYFMSGSRRGPFYAHLQDGTLLVRLPEGDEKRDSMVYNPGLMRENFVMSLDFQFEPTQPADAVRFEFSQSADQSVALDLFKNKTWGLHWGHHNNWGSQTGAYDYLSPERIIILIIMRGHECAVYLNNEPLAYVSDCRTEAVVGSVPWGVSFHVLAAPGHAAVASFDNLRLWDLNETRNVK